MINYGEVSFIRTFLRKIECTILTLTKIKLKVNNTFKKTEKITTKFEAVNDEYVINKEFLDTKLAEVKGQIPYIEKHFNEFRDHERHNEDVSIERGVKTTIQILYDKGFFHKYNNADEKFKGYLLFDEVNERHRPDLEVLNYDDNVIQ